MATPTRLSRETINEYLRRGDWELTTFSDIWNRNAANFPDKEAVVDAGKRLTWSQAKQWIDRLALALLELGLKKDDVVVIQLPNSVELCLARVACERAGLVFLPVLRSYRHKELKQFLTMTRAAAIIIPWHFRDFDYVQMVRELRPGLPDLRHVLVAGDKAPDGVLSVEQIVRNGLGNKHDAGELERTKCPATEFSMVLPTSGSTGFPRLCENPVAAIMVREKASVQILKLTGDDVVGVFSPAPGGSNGRGYYAAPLAAAKIVFLEHWEAEKALQLIQKERVSVLTLVPTQLIQVLKHPAFERYDLSSLRVLMCMGAVLPYAVAEEAENRLPHCRLLQQYSAVGCSIGCTTSLDDDRRIRLGTVGKPYGGAVLKLINEKEQEVARGEVGEVMIKGPAGDSGYYNDPDATWQSWTRDGWFRMGDLGRLDEHGNLTIVGRTKDIIIRGGQNIYPSEIEGILVKHPGVAEVAIVGVPDAVMGEKACACVAPKPGRRLTLDEIVSFLRSENIAPYKLPERLELREKLPTVADGQKIDKKALAKEIAEKLSNR